MEIKKCIFPSTVLVYERPTASLLVESDRTQINSVYEASKLACEVLLNGYSVDFGFSCRIARLGNIYGPGGPQDSVVQIVLQQVIDGGPIKLRTTTSVRDFVYRDDVVTGLIALALHADRPGCEIFNLSSGVPTRVSELIETACRVKDLHTEIIETQPQKDGEIDALKVSIQKMKEKTGWQPKWDLEDGLRQTLAEMEPEAK